MAEGFFVATFAARLFITSPKKDMKKVFCLLTTVVLMVSCTNGKNGYTVSGTVEGAQDGQLVYLQRAERRNAILLDSTRVKGGKFTFKGTQDTTIACYCICQTIPGEQPQIVDFFLENGQINISLSQEDASSATGTPNNDIYQAMRDQTVDLMKQMEVIYQEAADESLTDEQRAEKVAEAEAVEDALTKMAKEGVKNNITNPVGIYLLKNNYYYMDVDELDPLMPQIPAEYDNDAAIVRIKENVAQLKLTTVGEKFIDFEMETPDGKTMKLSDYAGRGKVVLVDFWASWCGPCRREMPNIVEAYKKYKGKKFEIVGVSFDSNADSWKAAIEQLNMTWPQMSDLKGWQSIGASLYAVSSIPHTMLIDGEGIILARGLHGEDLQEKLAEVLK